MTESIRRLCGQLLVGGFDGTVLDPDMQKALAAKERAGIILFSRNIPDLETASSINHAVLSACPDALTSVDQEGGRVARLKGRIIRLPTMSRLGALGDIALIRRCAQVLGAQLAALGFNLDFAPVLDTNSNPDNPVIGDRSFSEDPAVVAKCGRAFAEGLHSVGIMSCGKHFPGHGDTATDSHLDLPHVGHSVERLEQIELRPFEVLSDVLPSLMSAHVVFQALAEELPATLSRRIIEDRLRKQYGFQGLLFSDDLEMKALADRMSVEESAIGSIEAGCDVLLICRSMEWQERAHRALCDKASSEQAFRARCAEAAERCQVARKRFPARLPTRETLDAALGSTDASELQEELARRLP
ncbi:MAG: beta-N-acetylhexosaminidase [Polyangiaceae bacterium]|nr:beta-N-acetylhexosaminidase [Polyangiaceae bacterium]